MTTQVKTDVDPVRYEMFRHRLYNILEEGRIAIQRVSGSPIVTEGGECMASFYDTNGRAILTSSGLLLHCTGCQDAIARVIEWYSDDPGIHDGDQFFVNDPYIAGTHVFDMMVVKPIFHEGRRIAWAGTMMHTSDTGGVLRGGATEIYHEGIRFQGVKIVESGKFRPDVFRAITEQCRDPHFVGLDLKARIAASNICARNYLDLVGKYGVDFIELASQKIIDDSEAMARARLRSMPDGVWRSRVHNQAMVNGRPVPFEAVCTMTKTGDEITFDFTGSSLQNSDTRNCTIHGAWSALFVAIAGHLFWNVPWNQGMIAPVNLIVPEGTFLNCRMPAACGESPATGAMLTGAAHDCIGKMLYAGGYYEDINAIWRNAGLQDHGRYGGHNQFGGVIPLQIYDHFAGGLGGTPLRDGVDSGANPLNPQSKVSDVELIEMNYPMLFLCRNHLRDGGGWGNHDGGMPVERIIMVYGSLDFTDNYGHWLPIPFSRGQMGGYPALVPDHVIVRTRDMSVRLRRSEYPATHRDLRNGEYGPFESQDRPFGRVPIREYDLLVDIPASYAGGGFGDPLDRSPRQVADDVRDDVVSARIAEEIYGVVLKSGTIEVDEVATEAIRSAIRKSRIAAGSERSVPTPRREANGRKGLRFHECLEIVDGASGKVIQCLRCGHEFCPASENYKRHALQREVDYREFELRSMLCGLPSVVIYQEYVCPGCGTMLEVDLRIPQLDAPEPFWDIQILV